MKYIIVIDKQPRTNPTNERKEITFEIGELCKKGDVHDGFIIENGYAKVIRRIALSKYNVTSVLENEVIEDLGKAKLPLFEGDNYIYVKDEYNNQMCAEYIVKSDFTDMYVTKLEMKSEIEQTSQKIELSVSNTYVTKGELNTAKSEIKQTTDAITSTVSKKVGNDEIISKINQSAESVTIDANKISLERKRNKFNSR